MQARLGKTSVPTSPVHPAPKPALQTLESGQWHLQPAIQAHAESPFTQITVMHLSWHAEHARAKSDFVNQK